MRTPLRGLAVDKDISQANSLSGKANRANHGRRTTAESSEEGNNPKDVRLKWRAKRKAYEARQKRGEDAMTAESREEGNNPKNVRWKWRAKRKAYEARQRNIIS